DSFKPAELRRIRNINVINGGYVADGYAHVKGIRALITTFGVSEPSAIRYELVLLQESR
ncbi:hypothetical protein COCMIDRAFT_108811, partial [Bipolaris oryzae ATCC 44560]